MSYRIGIDIGGTFTDFALLAEADSRLVIHKQLTTPAEPARSVLSGLPILLEKSGVAMAEVDTIVHGTTLVTNAVIEQRGAVTGFLCTKGFSDVLDIARAPFCFHPFGETAQLVTITRYKSLTDNNKFP